jgi:hypothetical protein
MRLTLGMAGGLRGGWLEAPETFYCIPAHPTHESACLPIRAASPFSLPSDSHHRDDKEKRFKDSHNDDSGSGHHLGICISLY